MRIHLVWLILPLLFSCQSQNPEAEHPESVQTVHTALHEIPAPEAGLKRFVWQAEMCEYMGDYDTTRYTEQQLRDTYYLWFEFNSMTSSEADETLDYPWQFTGDHISNTSQKLTEDYQATVDKLRALDVIPTQPFLELKQIAMLHLDELYELQKLTLDAHRNPALLLNNPYTNHCNSYAQALASTDTTVLLDAYKQVIEEIKSKNMVPEYIERRYQESLGSPDKLLLARIEVMTYGWWNCANRQRRYVDALSSRHLFEKQFIKLFEKVHHDCDDACC